MMCELKEMAKEIIERLLRERKRETMLERYQISGDLLKPRK